MSAKSFFTKKHYEFIADIINNLGDICGIQEYHNDLATFVANKLEGTNPLFRRDLFIKACGAHNDGSNDTADSTNQ